MKTSHAVIAAAAAVVIGIGGGAVIAQVAGHDDASKAGSSTTGSPTPSTTPKPSTATKPSTTTKPAVKVTTPPAAPTGTKPQLVDYTRSDPAGVQIDTLADVDKLRGAPEDFKEYLRGIVVDGLPNSDCAARLNVERVRSDGFAFGGSGENCKGQGGSGWVSFWAKRDGVWKEVIGTQDIALCKDLKAVSFPADVYGLVPKCAVGNDVVAYQG